MSYKEIIEAFQIFDKYPNDGELSAEHDELFAGPGLKVSEEDEKRLNELGWDYDEGTESWQKFA